jgi:PhoPQ-activated pathogenicity-related protein
LDNYVAKPDSSYAWNLAETIQTGNLTTHVIRLTSQRWRTEQEVDRPLWEHWLVVTVPAKITTDRVFLMIGGGSHTSPQPKGPDAITGAIAASTGGVVAELKNIPNQPLIFHNDGTPRVEDDLIGYSWAQFLETGDPTWLPRLPMVKSVVRAMDCITEFSASEAGGKRKVNKFIVGGGSKRGWTTWMAGAATPDPRFRTTRKPMGFGRKPSATTTSTRSSKGLITLECKLSTRSSILTITATA